LFTSRVFLCAVVILWSKILLDNTGMRHWQHSVPSKARAGLWHRHCRQMPMGLRRRRDIRKMTIKYFGHTLVNQSVMFYAL